VTTPAPPEHVDGVIVGAGILGLAVARELLRRRPGFRVAVLEQERDIAQHQTGHNSGVVHGGIYYAPGSLKAELCVRGAAALYELCELHGVRYERCGKVIVATDSSELGRLDELERRGVANGVPNLRRLNAEELREVEPHARGIAALHSPETGIVDFPAVATVLAAEVEAAGGEVVTGCAVSALEERNGGVRIRHAQGESLSSFAIACAGLWSDRLAGASGLSSDPRIVPFRGAYLRLRPERRELVRGLVYPVPDPLLPFLGIHLTRHINGDVLLGPSALLVGARDAYSLAHVRPRDLFETLTWPGTARVVRRWWRTGLTEMHHAASRRAFVEAARRYMPELEPDDVLPGHAGVRAQAVARDGSLVDDFVFAETARTLHVRNAPSPGATSSLAIAEHVTDRASTLFGWDA
jgi:L-2-hydroxyglutarate oxidase